jgi:ferredoxin-NADP reductase/Na+-translocating ferredoxin:NAD+ oxidoreductase RnfD subunit
MFILDNFLARITMYRLVLYVLIALVVVSSVLSFLTILPYNPLSVIISSLFLLFVCLLVNKVFSYLLKVPANVESVYITALILALIITPSLSVQNFIFLLTAGTVAMASKYVVAFKKRHIFNPAAFSVVVTGLIISGFASWWVGTLPLFPFVLVLGLIILRKIQRVSMVFTYLLVTVAGIFAFSLFNQVDFVSLLSQLFVFSPLLFFTFIMLTEPLTAPTKRRIQIIYASIVSVLLFPQLHLGSFYFTPESSLLIGNIFSYFASPNYKLYLILKSKKEIAEGIYEFSFAKEQDVKFESGQYMEWLLPHKQTDSRGNRRFFSISSSPTEKNISITVRFNNPSSSFKKSLLELKEGDRLLSGNVAGEFVMPDDFKKPMVFIAGGVGIAPFRSMAKYILDNDIKTDIILVYSNREEKDIAYKDLFEKVKKNGFRTLYVLTDEAKAPSKWDGEVGRLNKEILEKKIPDYKKRIFYLSGPQLMIDSFKGLLIGMGISRTKIKTDFFPGYTETK